MNINDQDQILLKGMHSGEISSISFNPVRNLVVTCQNSITDRMDQPFFVIWQLLVQDDNI
jgi:hypothetical protein